MVYICSSAYWMCRSSMHIIVTFWHIGDWQYLKQERYKTTQINTIHLETYVITHKLRKTLIDNNHRDHKLRSYQNDTWKSIVVLYWDHKSRPNWDNNQYIYLKYYFYCNITSQRYIIHLRLDFKNILRETIIHEIIVIYINKLHCRSKNITSKSWCTMLNWI